MDIVNAPTDVLLQRHIELEDEIAAARNACDELQRESDQDRSNLALIVAVTNANRACSALLEEHTLVIGTLDHRDVRYRNWERYNRAR